MSDPMPWEVPFIERVQRINEEVQIITLEGADDEEHRGEIFNAYQTEPTLEAIRELNIRLRDLSAQVIKIHWHGGYDEDLDQVEGPSWTVDVLLMGEATDEDVTREGGQVGLELNPIHMGFFWKREGMED